MRALAIAILALAVVPDAAAKLCASVTVAPKPAAGQTVQVTLTTWMPRWEGSRAEFNGLTELPASSTVGIVLARPGGASATIALRRSEVTPSEWHTKVRFAKRGTYAFGPDSRWTFAPLTCQPRLRVVVR